MQRERIADCVVEHQKVAGISGRPRRRFVSGPLLFGELFVEGGVVGFLMTCAGSMIVVFWMRSCVM